MLAPTLKSDSTIRDVQSTLAKPDEYVRVVLGHMMSCFKQHGNAYVRIGITGHGTHPSHKIVYTGPEGEEALFGAFGERLPFTDNIIHVNTWSTARMSTAEVREFLGEMRGWKGGASKNARKP